MPERESESRFDGSERHAERRRDLRLGEFAEISVLDDPSLFSRKHREQIVCFACAPAPDDRLGRIGFGRCLQEAAQERDEATPLPPAIVDCSVPRDREEPWPQATFARFDRIRMLP